MFNPLGSLKSIACSRSTTYGTVLPENHFPCPHLRPTGNLVPSRMSDYVVPYGENFFSSSRVTQHEPSTSHNLFKRFAAPFTRCGVSVWEGGGFRMSTIRFAASFIAQQLRIPSERWMRPTTTVVVVECLLWLEAIWCAAAAADTHESCFPNKPPQFKSGSIALALVIFFPSLRAYLEQVYNSCDLWPYTKGVAVHRTLSLLNASLGCGLLFGSSQKQNFVCSLELKSD